MSKQKSLKPKSQVDHFTESIRDQCEEDDVGFYVVRKDHRLQLIALLKQMPIKECLVALSRIGLQGFAPKTLLDAFLETNDKTLKTLLGEFFDSEEKSLNQEYETDEERPH